MTPEQTQPHSIPSANIFNRAGYVLATIWIFGGACWFYIHFSYIFYLANKSSIDAALARLSEALR